MDHLQISLQTIIIIVLKQVNLLLFPLKSSDNLWLILNFFYNGGPYTIETSPLICSSCQWAGLYMVGTPIMNELNGKFNWSLTIHFHSVAMAILYCKIWNVFQIKVDISQSDLFVFTENYYVLFLASAFCWN